MRLVTAAKEHCVEGEEGNLGCDIDAIVASSTERLANFIHLDLAQLLNVTRYQLEPNVENKVVKEFNIIAWSRHRQGNPVIETQASQLQQGVWADPGQAL